MGLWVFLLLGAIAFIAFILYTNNKKGAERLAAAEAEARQLYDRLGGQTMNLTAPGDNRAAGQALSDAGERYTAAGAALESAETVSGFRAAAQSSIEGLYYVRAAREAMDMDPGPAVPELKGTEGVGRLKEPVSAEVEGQTVSGSPQPTEENTHYHPGGRVEGRPVPAGWYSTPWWQPAAAGVAGGIASVMVFNALLAPAYAGGMVDGASPEAVAGGADSDADAGADDGGGGMDDMGDFGGADGLDIGGF
ncbi:hypothetical protein [Haloglycomyces albus]|uniref:hypothetical protein n=1 Tax=Haloglycomyces albus TaxID=526067 RepID=UPI00046CCCC2|nr:hypothetical protein [Haloglycomyces albus]